MKMKNLASRKFRSRRWPTSAAAMLGLVLVGSMAVSPGQTAQALENDLALTPPMGWNSWNQVRCNGLNENLVKETADAMASNGMAAAGYNYVVVDDCWQGGRDAGGELFSHPERFPSGMKALGAYIHSKGLKFGIYGVPGTETCANFWDNYPIYGLGSLNHEQQDADAFADWGVDYLKYDWCRADETDQLVRADAFGKMRDALKSTGRDIVYGISEYGVTEPWTWGKGVANLWRTTHDIAPTWASISGIIDEQAGLSQYAGPGSWNDPDMLQVGNGNLTNAENRSHFGMWSMLAAPLFLGTDVTGLSPETMATVTNAEVIAVNQDVLGKQAVRVRKENGIQVWTKELAGGDIAVALLNTTETEQLVTSNVSEIKGTGRYTVRSLWDGQDVINTSSVFSSTVPRHGTAILRLTPGSRPGLPTVPEVSGSITLDAGGSGTMSVSVRNPGNTALRGATLSFAPTTGLTLPSSPVAIPAIAPGEHATVKVTVSAASTSVGSFTVPATLTVGDTHFAAQLGVNVLLPASVYLSDLPWVSSTNGWGPVERDKAVGDKAAGDGPAIELGGVTYPKGLGTNSPATVKVSVASQCTTFRAVIGMDDDVIPRAAKDNVTPRSTFEVYADGVEIYTKSFAQGIDEPTALEVDITGATVIELRNNLVGTANTASWHAWADWADAKLECVTRDTVPPTVAIDSDTAANPAGWWKAPVVLSVQGSDDRGDNVTLESRIADAEWRPYTEAVKLSEEGIHVFQARAQDVAGNTSEPAEITVQIDRTGPILTLGTNAAQKSITAKASDDLSGLVALEYQLAGATSWLPYTGAVVVDESVQVRIRATDAAGNTTVQSIQRNPLAPTQAPTTPGKWEETIPPAPEGTAPAEAGNDATTSAAASTTTLEKNTITPPGKDSTLVHTGAQKTALALALSVLTAVLGYAVVTLNRKRGRRYS